MAQGGRDDTVIDVESLASSMEKLLTLSPDSCIFRTPSILARHKPEAYIPNCFSFGPFHHDKADLKVTETIKLKYLRGVLSRSDDRKTKLRECLGSIKEVERIAVCTSEWVLSVYWGDFILIFDNINSADHRNRDWGFLLVNVR